MRVLNALRRVFNSCSSAGPPPPLQNEKELDALRRCFRTRHHNFKLLLACNNEALEHISKLEELARGAHPFGEHAVRAYYTQILTLAYKTIKYLKKLSPVSHASLLEQFQHIKDNINAILATDVQAKPQKSVPLMVPLEQITKHSVDIAGAKMARLGEARNVLGMPVPLGFVMTTAAFDTFMTATNLRREIHRRIQANSDDLRSQLSLAQELQNLILETPLPPELEQTLMQAGATLAATLGDAPKFVVRSSATGEDQAGASFAGQHRSVVNVSLELLPRVYKEVIASTYSLEAISYRANKGISEKGSAMAVGVLSVVNAVAGGVSYSRDPIGTRADSLLIYSVFGLPKQMVDGADAADFYALARNSGEELERDIGEKHSRTICHQHEGVLREKLPESLCKTSSLDKDAVNRIYKLAMALERHFGDPQDVEWAQDKNGEIYVLQARPLPTARTKATIPHELRIQPPFSNENKESHPETLQHAELGRGVTVSPGVAAGPVHIIQREADMLSMPHGAVMVLQQPLPRFAAALADASAIVAEEGGVAGHLASVARELGKPAIFGMLKATSRLVQNDIITVDADAMLILQGRAHAHLKQMPQKDKLMQGTQVHTMLLKIMPYISSLTLRSPQSSTFSAKNCKSLHDIFRFCHEQALLGMFEFGKGTPFPERAAQLQFGGKSSQFKIIDLNDSFHESTHNNKILVEHVRSLPFQAFWHGFTCMPWHGPPAMETKGMTAILHEAMLNTNLEPTQPSAYSSQNYFMVAPNFMSSQTRFGFHFSTVEALVGDRPRENYISFQFKGGAANQKRREARATLVSSLLEELGFESRRTLDCVSARIDNRPAHTMKELLAALGFLTMHTRQLDMVLNSKAKIHTYKEKLLEQLGAFVM